MIVAKNPYKYQTNIQIHSKDTRQKKNFIYAQ